MSVSLLICWITALMQTWTVPPGAESGSLAPRHCLSPAAAQLWGRRWPGAEYSADSLLEYSCWSRDFKSAVRLYLAMGRKHFARCLQLLSCWKPLFRAAPCGAWYSLDFHLVPEFYYCPCWVYFKTLIPQCFGFFCWFLNTAHVNLFP